LGKKIEITCKKTTVGGNDAFTNAAFAIGTHNVGGRCFLLARLLSVSTRFSHRRNVYGDRQRFFLFILQAQGLSAGQSRQVAFPALVAL
jgi:hypothetical protein